MEKKIYIDPSKKKTRLASKLSKRRIFVHVLWKKEARTGLEGILSVSNVSHGIRDIKD